MSTKLGSTSEHSGTCWKEKETHHRCQRAMGDGIKAMYFISVNQLSNPTFGYLVQKQSVHHMTPFGYQHNIKLRQHFQNKHRGQTHITNQSQSPHHPDTIRSSPCNPWLHHSYLTPHRGCQESADRMVTRWWQRSKITVEEKAEE